MIPYIPYWLFNTYSYYHQLYSKTIQAERHSFFLHHFEFADLFFSASGSVICSKRPAFCGAALDARGWVALQRN